MGNTRKVRETYRLVTAWGLKSQHNQCSVEEDDDDDDDDDDKDEEEEGEGEQRQQQQEELVIGF